MPARGRQEGIDGNVGAARLEDAQKCDEEIERLGEGHGDARLRADAEFPQPVGQQVGPAVQLPVGQAGRIEQRAIALAMERQIARRRTPFGGRRHRHVADRRLGRTPLAGGAHEILGAEPHRGVKLGTRCLVLTVIVHERLHRDGVFLRVPHRPFLRAATSQRTIGLTSVDGPRRAPACSARRRWCGCWS